MFFFRASEFWTTEIKNVKWRQREFAVPSDNNTTHDSPHHGMTTILRNVTTLRENGNRAPWSNIRKGAMLPIHHNTDHQHNYAYRQQELSGLKFVKVTSHSKFHDVGFAPRQVRKVNLTATGWTRQLMSIGHSSRFEMHTRRPTIQDRTKWESHDCNTIAIVYFQASDITTGTLASMWMRISTMIAISLSSPPSKGHVTVTKSRRAVSRASMSSHEGTRRHVILAHCGVCQWVWQQWGNRGNVLPIVQSRCYLRCVEVRASLTDSLLKWPSACAQQLTVTLARHARATQTCVVRKTKNSARQHAQPFSWEGCTHDKHSKVAPSTTSSFMLETWGSRSVLNASKVHLLENVFMKSLGFENTICNSVLICAPWKNWLEVMFRFNMKTLHIHPS